MGVTGTSVTVETLYVNEFPEGKVGRKEQLTKMGLVGKVGKVGAGAGAYTGGKVPSGRRRGTGWVVVGHSKNV